MEPWDDNPLVPIYGSAEDEAKFGKCANLHGHTYNIIVVCEGQVEEYTGMVINYFDIDAVVKPFIEMTDHKFLNWILKTNLTTAENISFWFYKQLAIELHELKSVRVQETPKTYSEFAG